LGRFLPTATTATTYGETNIAGYPAQSFWVASFFTTNSGVATLPDLMPNGYNLTNTAASIQCPIRVAGGWHGQDYISFNGAASGQFLESDKYTNQPPYELVLVCLITNNFANNPVFFDGVNASFRWYVYASANTVYSVVNAQTFGAVTNRWFILDFLQYTVPATTGAIYTNDVLAASGGTGTPGNTGGFLVASRTGLTVSRFANMNVAEIITFTNKLPGTNAIAQLALFQAITNHIPISP
jgi:hypothetical protein